MNTDNISIRGETFDYGPCAFMNSYHPDTVFSSIDQNGRYAFGNQPEIIKWNIAIFAEALLPMLHENKETALELAQTAIDGLDAIWHEKYYETMLGKIGIEQNNPDHYALVDNLLELMQNLTLDYTNTFWALSQDISFENNPINRGKFNPWLKNWQDIIHASNGMQRAQQLMKTHNPAVIPRNHLVEQALDNAVKGDLALYEKVLGVVSQPYHQPNDTSFMKQSDLNFENWYQTFCGT